MARSTYIEKSVTDQLSFRINDIQSTVSTIEEEMGSNSISDTMPAGTIKGNLLEEGSPENLTPEEVRQLLIDDSQTSTSDLWSSQKIQDINTTLSDRLDSVETSDVSQNNRLDIIEATIVDAAEVTFDDTETSLGVADIQSAVEVVKTQLNNTYTISNIERRDVTEAVVFTNDSFKYQHLIVTAASNATLPSTPILGKHFIIKNSPTSTSSITINSVLVLPGDIYEALYDGVEWVVL